MDEKLVTVARFTTGAEAELLRGALAANDIQSVMDGEAIASAQPFPAAGWANVRVQVRESDLRQATRLVAEHDAAAVAALRAPAVEACLSCGAPLAANATRCAACGWTWVDETAA